MSYNLMDCFPTQYQNPDEGFMFCVQVCGEETGADFGKKINVGQWPF